MYAIICAYMYIYIYMGFPGGSDDTESACSRGDLGFYPLVRKFPWRREWPATPVFLPGEFHGQRSLEDSMGLQRVGYD